MVKVKEISVEVKKSKSFQTFTASETLEVYEGEDVSEIKKEAFKRCRDEVLEQIRIDQLPTEAAKERKIIKG